MDYREEDWFRYALARDWRKQPRHPVPSPEWQKRELGHDPDTKYPDDWMWNYNPRSSKSRKLLQEFVNAES